MWSYVNKIYIKEKIRELFRDECDSHKLCYWYKRQTTKLEDNTVENIYRKNQVFLINMYSEYTSSLIQTKLMQV